MEEIKSLLNKLPTGSEKTTFCYQLCYKELNDFVEDKSNNIVNLRTGLESIRIYDSSHMQDFNNLNQLITEIEKKNVGDELTEIIKESSFWNRIRKLLDIT